MHGAGGGQHEVRNFEQFCRLVRMPHASYIIGVRWCSLNFRFFGTCMDIYRFFHPHHNPRLHSTPLRQQELSELEQAASELRKALERAQSRTMRKPAGAILPGHFADIIKAMRFVEYSLQTLCDAHPGDPQSVLLDLVNERSGFSGWEAWTSLLKEQLAAGISEARMSVAEPNAEESEDFPLRKAG